MSNTGGTSPPSPPPSYSLAFERFVQGDEDLPGLIAYGLYKQSINEKAKAGQPLPTGAQRVPSTTDVKTFREAATRRLQEFAAAAVEEAREDVIQAGIGQAVAVAKAEILEKITDRTGMGSAVIANTIAWLLSILITILVVYGASRPGMQEWLMRQIPSQTQGAAPG